MPGTVLSALWWWFSHPVVSDSLQPHVLQHARLPCPSPSPEVCPLSCPLHWWGHPLILWCPLLLPSIISIIRVFSNESAFHIRWLKHWSFCISPSNKYSGLTSLKIDCLISLLSKGPSAVFSSTTVQRHQLFGVLPSLQSSSHNHSWPLEDHSLDYMDLCRQSNVSAFQHTV